MGRPTPEIPSPPSNGGGGGGGLVQQILDWLERIWGIGRAKPDISTVTLATGGTFQQMFAGSKKVRQAIIQNISTEDVTITTITQNQVAATGIILNKATAANQAGGSMPVGNVDLAEFYFVRTTAGLSLAVYSES